MNCIIKIKQLSDSFTKSERKLASYLLGNLESIKGMNAYDIAIASDVSQPTIIRFARKIGYKGFSDFKLALIEDLGRRAATRASEKKFLHNKITVDDTIGDIKEKIASENIDAIRDTILELDDSILNKTIEVLDKAKRIFILGVGYSGLTAKSFHYKLLEIGKSSIFDSDSHVQFTSVTSITSEDVVFAISHSGKTLEVLKTLEKAKKRGAKIITLTKVGSNPINELSDLKLTLVAEEGIQRSTAVSSSIGQLTVIDTIVMGMTLENRESALDYINQSNEAIKVFRVEK